MKYPDKSLEKGIAETLAMANAGDHFLCCIQHKPECPNFVNSTCSCKIVEISDTTTVEEIAALYRSAMN